MWPNNGDQLSPSGSRHDIPMRAMVPNATGIDVINSKLGESRDKSKPPDEMKLVSDLLATGILDFNCTLVDRSENMPLNNPVQYRPSNRSAPLKISATNAITNLELILRPLRMSGKGYCRATLNRNLETRIQDMLSLLRLSFPIINGSKHLDRSP